MSTELQANQYDTAAFQRLAWDIWERARAFHAEPGDPGEPYAVVIPPPNVTAALHLGHALNNTLQDILIRVHRMRGFNTVWLPGTDHAGIATQTVVEKRVLREEGKRRTEFPREQFVRKIQQYKDEYEQVILGQLKAMACSCDWDRTAFTMDAPRARAVREAFFRLFRDGLIYRGKRLVNWDPVTQTALADDEVEMEEVDGHFYYLRYPLEDGSGHVTVATTRPETMLGDTAVAINPRDPRAAALRGKKLRLPIVNRLIPLIEDDYVVMPDPGSADAKARFATGFLKVTPAHDPNDYEIGQRHQLPTINVMAPDASISLSHGWGELEPHQEKNSDLDGILGATREEARKRVVSWFKEHGLLEDVKPYRHSVGHSYRSHAAIEPYLSDQWYCRVTDDRLAGAALRAMDPAQRNMDGSADDSPGAAVPGEKGPARLTFHPARYARTFELWHLNIRDWCISRQLWWGHRIPVWSIDGTPSIPEHADLCVREMGGRTYVAVRSDDASLIAELERRGLVQDPDVLDTWFSSALWPLSTMGWPEDTPELRKWNPTNVLCTAREIITLWVSRMVMFNLYFLGRLPFRDVFIHAMIQDGEGRKMSKSLGNGVDPLDIIDMYGSDGLRFTLASMATNTQDVRMPVKRSEDGRNTSEKFDLGHSFGNKLWNAGRFVLNAIGSCAPEPCDERKWSMADRWIVSRFNRTVEEANQALATFRFDHYARACYDFFWRDFCDWYLEASKPAMRDPQRRAQTANVLAAVMDGVLRLLHPIIPSVTEVLWQKLCSAREERGLPGRIMGCTSPVLAKAAWPTVGDVSQAAEHIFPRIQEIISAIRNLRNDYRVDARKPVNVSIRASADASRQILALQDAIEQMATCKLVSVDPELPDIPDSATVSVAGCNLFVEGLVDRAAEQARISKRKEELDKLIRTLRGRLANEGYIARAPANLVEETRKQLADAEAERETLG
jgi:valyl-tRNA synthetase